VVFTVFTEFSYSPGHHCLLASLRFWTVVHIVCFLKCHFLPLILVLIFIPILVNNLVNNLVNDLVNNLVNDLVNNMLPIFVYSV